MVETFCVEIEIRSIRMQVWIFILIAKLWWPNEKIIATERWDWQRTVLDVRSAIWVCALCRNWLDTNESAVERELTASQWWLEQFILRNSQTRNGSNTRKLDAFEIKTNYVQFFNVASKRCGVHYTDTQTLWGIFTAFSLANSSHKHWPIALIRQLVQWECELWWVYPFERCCTEPNRTPQLVFLTTSFGFFVCKQFVEMFSLAAMDSIRNVRDRPVNTNAKME